MKNNDKGSHVDMHVSSAMPVYEYPALKFVKHDTYENAILIRISLT